MFLLEALRKWYLTIPVILVVAGVFVPLAYLVARAFQADLATLYELVVRWRNAVLLFNTLSLTVGVLVVSSLIALPLAWLTARVEFKGRLILTVVGVLPLAVPGYVMAYVLLATTGEYGTLARSMGVVIPRISGFGGALVALSLTTFPYLFLNLRTALVGLDPSLEESAQSLGSGRVEVFTRVLLPQLKPAFLAGGLLVGLHVLGDFGVVSLMRFETFSYALFLQYTASYDRIYAAWLALILLGLTLVALAIEAYMLKGMMFHSGGEGDSDGSRGQVQPGNWIWSGYLFGGAVAFLSVGLPVITVGYWMSDIVPGGLDWGALAETTWNSVSVSIPSALLSAMLALPVAYLGVRRDNVATRALERIAYLGYATPRLAFALAWIVFVLAVFPVGYQTLPLLILAYGFHFMAEAIGPIRSTFYQIPPSLKEAARSLGSGSFGVFSRVLFPLLRRGVLVGVAFVFLSVMKDLPLALLLSPPGFRTLATSAWSYAEEAMFASAAPYALAIMLFSALFVGLLLRRE